MKNTKRRGSQYEAAFVTQALKRGLDILEPYGDYMPYDLMVQNVERLTIRFFLFNLSETGTIK